MAALWLRLQPLSAGPSAQIRRDCALPQRLLPSWRPPPQPRHAGHGLRRSGPSKQRAMACLSLRLGRVCPAASGPGACACSSILCAAGALPPPVACSACDAGLWIEFDPEWPAPSAAATNAPMRVRQLWRAGEALPHTAWRLLPPGVPRAWNSAALCCRHKDPVA